MTDLTAHDASDIESEDIDSPKTVQTLNQHRKKVRQLLAVLCMAGIVASQLGSVYLDKAVLDSNFNKPYFLVWFNISWNLLCPLLSSEFWQHVREHYQLKKRSPLLKLIKPAFFLSILWVGESWAYFLAVNDLAVSIALVLSQSSMLWVFGFSIFMFPDFTVTSSKMLSLFLCAAGVALVIADNWSGGSTVFAVIFALLSAIGWGLYECCFKKVLGDATLLEVNAFLGMVGFFVIFTLWIPIPILNISGIETFAWPNQTAWSGLVAAAALTLLMHFLLNAANALSSPLFVRISSTMATPISIFIDILLGYEPGGFCFVGVALIIVGFLLVNVPEEKSLALDRKIGLRKPLPDNYQPLIQSNSSLN